MSSCISEEAFTAQQMKTDEKGHPLMLGLVAYLSGTNANVYKRGTFTEIYITPLAPRNLRFCVTAEHLILS